MRGPLEYARCLGVGPRAAGNGAGGRQRQRANQWLERDRDSACRAPPIGRFRPAAWDRPKCWLSDLHGNCRRGCGWRSASICSRPASAWPVGCCMLFVYTPLKSRTPLNTVVGAVAGGVARFDGLGGRRRALGLPAATLFLIVFLWQFPHFMAIAWIYRHQYAAAGMRMLPVVDPTRASGRRAGVVCGAGPAAGEPGAGGGELRRAAVFRLGRAAGRWPVGVRRAVSLSPQRRHGPHSVASLVGLSADVAGDVDAWDRFV